MFMLHELKARTERELESVAFTSAAVSERNPSTNASAAFCALLKFFRNLVAFSKCNQSNASRPRSCQDETSESAR